MTPEQSQDAARSADDLERLAFFTAAEARIAGAAMARIFPDDDLGPGARAAGTLYYLDRALGGAEMELQGFYRSALRRLEAVAVTRFGTGFAASTPAQQDELIAALAADSLPEFGRAPGGLAFFAVLRSHTIEGMFSDPAHGGNRDLVGWRLLGYYGPQPSYSHAEQQLDAKIVRDRYYTAADYPLPESGS
jgi:gluconate 2-dehydrogenase gamma chain